MYKYEDKMYKYQVKSPCRYGEHHYGRPDDDHLRPDHERFFRNPTPSTCSSARADDSSAKMSDCRGENGISTSSTARILSGVKGILSGGTTISRSTFWDDIERTDHDRLPMLPDWKRTLANQETVHRKTEETVHRKTKSGNAKRNIPPDPGIRPMTNINTGKKLSKELSKDANLGSRSRSTGTGRHITTDQRLSKKVTKGRSRVGRIIRVLSVLSVLQYSGWKTKTKILGKKMDSLQGFFSTFFIFLNFLLLNLEFVQAHWGTGCSTTDPIQTISQKNGDWPAPISGLHFTIDPTDQVNDVVEVGMKAESGELHLTDVLGITFTNYTHNRFLRFRGTQQKVQEAFQKLEYRPARNMYKLTDDIEIICMWTKWGGSQYHDYRGHNRIYKKMHIELQDSPLFMNFPTKFYSINEDEVLMFGNLTITDPVFQANAPGEDVTTMINMTIATSSHSKISFLDRHFDVKLNVVRSVPEFNILFQMSPLLVRGAADFATDICNNLIEVEFTIRDVKNPDRMFKDSIFVEIKQKPDPIVLRSEPVDINADPLDKMDLRNYLQVRESTQTPDITLHDVDHCCFAGAEYVNDESLAIIAWIPFVKMQITPSPYVSSASCMWSTADPSGAYPVNNGGWVKVVDLHYAQHAIRPTYKVIKGLRGPDSHPDERIPNLLQQPNSGTYQNKNVGGIWAQRIKLKVKQYEAFPGMKFEVYGCDPIDLVMGGNQFTQIFFSEVMSTDSTGLPLNDPSTGLPYPPNTGDTPVSITMSDRAIPNPKITSNVTCHLNLFQVNNTQIHMAKFDRYGRPLTTIHECQYLCSSRHGNDVKGCYSYTFLTKPIEGVQCFLFNDDCPNLIPSRNVTEIQTVYDSEHFLDNPSTKLQVYTYRRDPFATNQCSERFAKPLVFEHTGQKIVKELLPSSTLFNFNKRTKKFIRDEEREDIVKTDAYKNKGIYDYFQPGGLNDTGTAWIPHFTDKGQYVEIVFYKPYWLHNIIISGDNRPQGILACLSCGSSAQAMIKPLTLTRDDIHPSYGKSELMVFAENQFSDHSEEIFIPVNVPPTIPTIVVKESTDNREDPWKQFKYKEGLEGKESIFVGQYLNFSIPLPDVGYRESGITSAAGFGMRTANSRDITVDVIVEVSDATPMRSDYKIATKPGNDGMTAKSSNVGNYMDTKSWSAMHFNDPEYEKIRSREMSTAVGEYTGDPVNQQDGVHQENLGFLTTKKLLTQHQYDMIENRKFHDIEDRTQTIEEMREIIEQVTVLKRDRVIEPNEPYEFSSYNTSLHCYACSYDDAKVFIQNLRYFPRDKYENGLKNIKISVYGRLHDGNIAKGKQSMASQKRQTPLEYDKPSREVEIPIYIEPVNQRPEVTVSCMDRKYALDGGMDWWSERMKYNERFGYDDLPPYYNNSFGSSVIYNNNFEKLKTQTGVRNQYKQSVEEARKKFSFIVDQTAVEARLCFNLTDDAQEHPQNYMLLSVTASVGKLVVPSVYRHFFYTECNKRDVKSFNSRKRRYEMMKFSACRITTVPDSFPSYDIVKYVLENLAYTAPAKYHGEVEIHVSVDDVGFAGGLNSGFGERGLKLDDAMMYSHADANVASPNATNNPSNLGEARERFETAITFTGYVARQNVGPIVRVENILPPDRILNNETWEFTAFKLDDVDEQPPMSFQQTPDNIQKQTEQDKKYSLTVEALYGSIDISLEGRSKLREELRVPAIPFPSRYIRWIAKTVEELNAIIPFVFYKPFEWFVGDDVFVIQLSDGDPVANKTTRFTHAVRVQQSVRKPEIRTSQFYDDRPSLYRERNFNMFGKAVAGVGGEITLVPEDLRRNTFLDSDKILEKFEGKEDIGMLLDFLHVYFPSPAHLLYFRIESVKTCCLFFPQDVAFGNILDTILESTKEKMVGLGSMEGINRVLNSTQFLHYHPNWHGEAVVSLKVCMYDNYQIVDKTCVDKQVLLDIKQIDDLPMVFSAQHPWTSTIKAQQEIDFPICCFEVVDPDQIARDSKNKYRENPFSAERLDSDYINPEAYGYFTETKDLSSAATNAGGGFTGPDGEIKSSRSILGGLPYTNIWNVTTSGFQWEEQDGAFPIQATIWVRDGEIFLPNAGHLVADVSVNEQIPVQNAGRRDDYFHVESGYYKASHRKRTKEIAVMGFPFLLGKALDKLVYRPAKGKNTRNSSPDSVCIRLSDYYDRKTSKFSYNLHRSFERLVNETLDPLFDPTPNEHPRISLTCWAIEIAPINEPPRIIARTKKVEVKMPHEFLTANTDDNYRSKVREETAGWFGSVGDFRIDDDNPERVVKKVEFFSEKNADIVIRGCGQHNLRYYPDIPGAGNTGSGYTSGGIAGARAIDHHPQLHAKDNTLIKDYETRLEYNEASPWLKASLRNKKANRWYLSGSIWKINECIQYLAYLPRSGILSERQLDGLQEGDMVTMAVTDTDDLVSKIQIHVGVHIKLNNLEEIGPVLFEQKELRPFPEKTDFPIGIKFERSIDLIRSRRVIFKIEMSDQEELSYERTRNPMMRLDPLSVRGVIQSNARKYAYEERETLLFLDNNFDGTDTDSTRGDARRKSNIISTTYGDVAYNTGRILDPNSIPSMLENQGPKNGTLIELRGRLDVVADELKRLKFRPHRLYETKGGHNIIFNATLHAENVQTEGEYDYIGSYSCYRLLPPDKMSATYFDGLSISLPKVRLRKYYPRNLYPVPPSTGALPIEEGDFTQNSLNLALGLEMSQQEMLKMDLAAEDFNRTVRIRTIGKLYSLYDLNIQFYYNGESTSPRWVTASNNKESDLSPRGGGNFESGIDGKNYQSGVENINFGGGHIGTDTAPYVEDEYNKNYRFKPLSQDKLSQYYVEVRVAVEVGELTMTTEYTMGGIQVIREDPANKHEIILNCRLDRIDTLSDEIHYRIDTEELAASQFKDINRAKGINDDSEITRDVYGQTSISKQAFPRMEIDIRYPLKSPGGSGQGGNTNGELELVNPSLVAVKPNKNRLSTPGDNFRQEIEDTRQMESKVFYLDILPDMEPPKITFRQPFRLPQFLLDEDYRSAAVKTAFRQPLVWGITLTPKDGQIDRRYKVRIGIPYGGKLELPLASLVFRDGGIQEQVRNVTNDTKWTAESIAAATDMANMPVDYSMQQYGWNTTDGTSNALYGELGSIYAGSAGINVTHHLTGEDMGYSLYAGRFIKYDPDQSNYFSIEAKLVQLNAVLDELLFTPDNFFHGTTYFDVSVMAMEYRELPVEDVGRGKTEFESEKIYGRVQHGRKPIFVEKMREDICKLVLTDPYLAEFGDPNENIFYHATTWGKHRLLPNIEVHTKSYLQKAAYNISDADSSQGATQTLDSSTSVEHSDLFFYGFPEEDCGPITVEIGLDGTPRQRTNIFRGGPRPPWRTKFLPTNRTTNPDGSNVDWEMVSGGAVNVLRGHSSAAGSLGPISIVNDVDFKSIRYIKDAEYLSGDVKELQGKGRLFIDESDLLPAFPQGISWDVVMDDTFIGDGSILVLHGLPSDINAALAHLAYSWTPHNPATIEDEFHPTFENLMYLTAFGRHGNTASTFRKIEIKADKNRNAPSVKMKWRSQFPTIQAHEDEPKLLPCLEITYTTPTVREVGRERYATVTREPRTPQDEHVIIKQDTGMRDTDFDNITLTFNVSAGLMAFFYEPIESRRKLEKFYKDDYTNYTTIYEASANNMARLRALLVDHARTHTFPDPTEFPHDVACDIFNTTNQRISKDGGVIDIPIDDSTGVSTGCRLFEVPLQPSIFDISNSGRFDLCGLWYFPPKDRNSWNNYSPRDRFASNTFLEVSARMANATSVNKPQLRERAPARVVARDFIRAPIHIQPKADPLDIDLESFPVKYQGEDFVVSDILRIRDKDGFWTKREPEVLHAPINYRFELKLLGEGSRFVQPLPPDCVNADVTNWPNQDAHNKEIGTSSFSPNLNLYDLTAINLTFPVPQLISCFDNMRIKLPANASLTLLPSIDTVDETLETTAPQVLFTIPANNSVDFPINVDLKMQIFFNKEIFRYEKVSKADGQYYIRDGNILEPSLSDQQTRPYATLIDCGVDLICNDDGGFGDNKNFDIFLDDSEQVFWDDSTLTIIPKLGFKWHGNRRYAIVLYDGIEDYYGNKFENQRYLVQFKTGPEQVLPIAWRVSGYTQGRWSESPAWEPMEVNLTNGSFTKSGEGWRVKELQIYTGADCASADLLTGTPISSGTDQRASEAYKAFDGDLDTYWSYDPDIVKTDLDLLEDYYANISYIGITDIERRTTCNNEYNGQIVCDRPGQYFVGLWLGQFRGANVQSFKVIPTDQYHTPMNVSLEFYHETAWHRLRVQDIDLTNLDACYSFPLSFNTSSAFQGDAYYDAKPPLIVATNPGNLYPTVDQEIANNVLPPKATIMIEFDENVYFNDNSTFMAGRQLGIATPNRPNSMVLPAKLYKANSGLCFVSGDDIFYAVPGIYKGLSIVQNKLLFRGDDHIVFGHTIENSKRYCLTFPYGFLRDSVGNIWPDDPVGYTMMWHTIASDVTTNSIAPKMLATSFSDGMTITDQPLNPLLQFYFSEPIRANPAYVGQTDGNITFTTTDSVHIVTMALSDSQQVSITDYGVISVRFAHEILKPGSTYTVNFPNQMLEDTQHQSDHLKTPQYQFNFTIGMVASKFGVKHMLPKPSEEEVQRTFTEKFLKAHEATQYFPTIYSNTSEYTKEYLLALYPTMNVSASIFDEVYTTFVVGSSTREAETSSQLYGLSVRHIYYQSNRLMEKTYDERSGDLLDVSVGNTGWESGETVVSRFVVKRANEQPILRVTTDPLRYIFTETPYMLTGVELEDDGYGQLQLNITVPEGTLTIASSAWWEEGPYYRRRLNAAALYKTVISDLSYSAYRYHLTGSVEQVKAALTNMTFRVDVASSRNPDSWNSNPIQDLPMEILIIDGEEYIAEVTLMYVVSSATDGPLRLKVNNVTSETDAVVVSNTVPTPPKDASASAWQQLGRICDYSVDKGGTNFERNTEYVVQLSSYDCTEFKLRDAIRSLESIATSLATIPVIKEPAMPVYDGGRVFEFRVPSIAALNRILAQEVMVKPCRCAIRSCIQTIFLSVTNLVLEKGKNRFDQMNSAEKAFYTVQKSCEMRVNLIPTIEVYSGVVLSLTSGQSLDISKSFVFQGMATVESDATDLKLNVTAHFGTFIGRTFYIGSSVQHLMNMFYSDTTLYVSPGGRQKPLIDKLNFTFYSPFFAEEDARKVNIPYVKNALGERGTAESQVRDQEKYGRSFIFEIEIDPEETVAGAVVEEVVKVTFDPPTINARVSNGTQKAVFSVHLNNIDIREAEIYINGGSPGCKLYFPNLYHMLESNKVDNKAATPAERTITQAYDKMVNMTQEERDAFDNAPKPSAQLRRISIPGLDTESSAGNSLDSTSYDVWYDGVALHNPYRELLLRGPILDLQRALHYIVFEAPEHNQDVETHVAVTVEVYEVKETLPLRAVLSTGTGDRLGSGLLDVTVLPANTPPKPWCAVKGPTLIYMARDDITMGLFGSSLDKDAEASKLYYPIYPDLTVQSGNEIVYDVGAVRDLAAEKSFPQNVFSLGSIFSIPESIYKENLDNQIVNVIVRARYGTLFPEGGDTSVGSIGRNLRSYCLEAELTGDFHTFGGTSSSLLSGLGSVRTVVEEKCRHAGILLGRPEDSFQYEKDKKSGIKREITTDPPNTYVENWLFPYSESLNATFDSVWELSGTMSEVSEVLARMSYESSNNIMVEDHIEILADCMEQPHIIFVTMSTPRSPYTDAHLRFATDTTNGFALNQWIRPTVGQYQKFPTLDLVFLDKRDSALEKYEREKITLEGQGPQTTGPLSETDDPSAALQPALAAMETLSDGEGMIGDGIFRTDTEGRKKTYYHNQAEVGPYISILDKVDPDAYFLIEVSTTCGFLRLSKEKRNGVYYIENSLETGLGIPMNATSYIRATTTLRRLVKMLKYRHLEITLPHRDRCLQIRPSTSGEAGTEYNSVIEIQIKLTDLRFTDVVTYANPIRIPIVREEVDLRLKSSAALTAANVIGRGEIVSGGHINKLTTCHAFIDSSLSLEKRVKFGESVLISDLFYIMDDALASDNNLKTLQVEISTTSGALFRAIGTVNQKFNWHGFGSTYEEGRTVPRENEFKNQNPGYNPRVDDVANNREDVALFDTILTTQGTPKFPPKATYERRIVISGTMVEINRALTYLRWRNPPSEYETKHSVVTCKLMCPQEVALDSLGKKFEDAIGTEDLRQVDYGMVDVRESYIFMRADDYDTARPTLRQNSKMTDLNFRTNPEHIDDISQMRDASGMYSHYEGNRSPGIHTPILPHFKVSLNEEFSVFDNTGWQLEYRNEDAILFVELQCELKCVMTNGLVVWYDKARITGSLDAVNEFLRAVTIKVDQKVEGKLLGRQRIRLKSWDSRITSALHTYEIDPLVENLYIVHNFYLDLVASEAAKAPPALSVISQAYVVYPKTSRFARYEIGKGGQGTFGSKDLGKKGRSYVDLENGFRLISRDAHNLEDHLDLTDITRKLSLVVFTRNPNAVLVMNTTAHTGLKSKRLVRYPLNTTDENGTEILYEHNAFEPNNTNWNYTEHVSDVDVTPAIKEGQRIELINKTATYLNAALLTLRYIKPSDENLGTRPKKGTKGYRWTPMEDDVDQAPAEDDLVTVQLIERTQSFDYRDHRGKNIVYRDRVVQEGSVPIFWMPEEARPYVYVDERNFDPFIRYDRFGGGAAQIDRSRNYIKPDNTSKPFIFFADHQNTIVEMGSVFSFLNIHSGGNVRVDCIKCEGFLMRRIATAEPMLPLTFTFRDGVQLYELMASLRYKARADFVGIDRVEVLIWGQKTHLSYTKLHPSSAFVGVRVTINEMREAPLIFGIRDPHTGVFEASAVPKERIWQEDSVYKLGFHMEPLEVELESDGVALVAKKNSDGTSTNACFRDHFGPGNILQTTGTTSPCALFNKHSIIINGTAGNHPLLRPHGYLNNVGAINATLGFRFASTAYPDHCITYHESIDQWKLFPCASAVVAVSPNQVFTQVSPTNETFCSVTETPHCFEQGRIQIQEALYLPKADSVYPNGDSCSVNYTTGGYYYNGSDIANVTDIVRSQCATGPDAGIPEGSDTMPSSSIYCKFKVENLPQLQPATEGCDMVLKVQFYCPNNVTMLQSKDIPILHWETFGGFVTRTIMCDAPFLYSRDTQYVLKLRSENVKGAFQLRYPKELKCLSYLSDYQNGTYGAVPERTLDPALEHSEKNLMGQPSYSGDARFLDPTNSSSDCYGARNATLEALRNNLKTARSYPDTRILDPQPPLMLATEPRNLSATYWLSQGNSPKNSCVT